MRYRYGVAVAKQPVFAAGSPDDFAQRIVKTADKFSRVCVSARLEF